MKSTTGANDARATTTTTGAGFNVAVFSAFLNSAGILRNNNFIVKIPFPSVLQRTTEFDTTDKSIQLACDTVTFPDSGVHTFKMQRYAYGAYEDRPLFPRFSPLTCTFICDQQAGMQKFFHEWIKTICNYDFANGIQATSATTTGGAMSVYEISYKSEYAVDIELELFNPIGEKVRHVQFRDAFPAGVHQVPLSWAAREGFIKIPVTFAFTDWFDVELHNL